MNNNVQAIGIFMIELFAAIDNSEVQKYINVFQFFSVVLPLFIPLIFAVISLSKLCKRKKKKVSIFPHATDILYLRHSSVSK